MEAIIAIILGISNIGLTIMLALRKESKEAAIRREQDLIARVTACDDERHKLRMEVVELRAKQNVWDSLLPHFKVVPSMAGGKRNYDDGPREFTHGEFGSSGGNRS